MVTAAAVRTLRVMFPNAGAAQRPAADYRVVFPPDSLSEDRTLVQRSGQPSEGDDGSDRGLDEGVG